MFKQIRNASRIFFGTIFAALGIIGVLLPLVPGIPFLLVSAVCFTSLEA